MSEVKPPKKIYLASNDNLKCHITFDTDKSILRKNIKHYGHWGKDKINCYCLELTPRPDNPQIGVYELKKVR